MQDKGSGDKFHGPYPALILSYLILILNERERERERESKCGVFSPAASDAEMDFIPAGIEGSPHYARGEHVATSGGCEAWSSSARPSATTSG
jgi:hypothetical protein